MIMGFSVSLWICYVEFFKAAHQFTLLIGIEILTIAVGSNDNIKGLKVGDYHIMYVKGFLGVVLR